MTPNSIYIDLSSFLDLLMRSGVAISISEVVRQRGQGGFQSITWATNNAAPGHLFRRHSASVSEYIEWVDCEGYSAVLFDGSLLQISYDFRHRTLVRHRLLYFPCPYDFDSADLLGDLSLLDVIDLYRSDGDTSVQLRSPVRFDYDRNVNGAPHPQSHMTFQWSHCRIPVMAPISLGNFIQFVFKNFYPQMWNSHTFIREWPRQVIGTSITPVERMVLHLNSTI